VAPGSGRRARLAAFGLTEPEAGSDAGATKTRAELRDGEWVVNGAKAFITNSGTELTSVVTVTARTGPDEISAILVPRERLASPSSPPTRSWAGGSPTPTGSRSTTATCPRPTCWAPR
jgi:alkylation response protein AidB-like acyl-CoA dehydrogenase